MLTGYIDESYSGESVPKTFVLSCLAARASEWFWIEAAWTKVLKDKNQQLARMRRPQMKRVHAVDMNNFANDFKDWNGEERKEFTQQLCRKAFNQHEMYFCGWSVNLADALHIWPEYADRPLALGYTALLLELMDELGEVISETAPNEKIALIHERCPYDDVLLNTFNVLAKDESYRHPCTLYYNRPDGLGGLRSSPTCRLCCVRSDEGGESFRGLG